MRPLPGLPLFPAVFMTEEIKSSDAHSEVHPHHAAAPDVSYGALTKLAAPIFVANLAIMGSATIDTLMAGNLGKEHLAVVALGSATSVMVLFGLVGILQGLSPIVGHHYGARKFRLIGFELTQSIWLSLLLGVIGCALLLQTGFWTDFGGVTGEVARMTSLFLTLTAPGIFASIVSRSFIALNSAVSRPRVTMYVSLMLLALKAPLNCVFMYGWFGFPALGGAGAGLSLAVAAWIALICYIVIYKKDAFYDKMRAEKFFWPQAKAILAQLKLGVPIGLSIFFEVSSFTLMAIFISRLGTTEVSAHQIVSNITATLYQIPLSIAIAVCVMVSQALGAGSPEAARTITLRGLKAGLAIACCSVAVMYFGQDTLLGFYSKETSVTNLAAALLIYGMIYHITDAAQTISNFALRGYRVTVAPMVIYGVMLWCVGLGGGYYFAFDGELFFGHALRAEGFWMCTAVGLCLAGISLAILALWVSSVRLRDAAAQGHEKPVR